MAIEEIPKNNSQKRKEFKVQPVRIPESQFGLTNQKQSLNRYNSNIRMVGGRLQIPTFPNDPPSCQIGEVALVAGQHKVCVPPELQYDGGTAAFTIGLLVTGASSNAIGRIVYIRGNSTAGTLGLTGVVGAFTDNETLTDSGSGSATVNGTLTASANQWVITGTQS